ncbi:MAG: carboxypeptidase regulatory-like domain-containing protein, partial [Planctomycetota bacterium]
MASGDRTIVYLFAGAALAAVAAVGYLAFSGDSNGTVPPGPGEAPVTKTGRAPIPDPMKDGPAHGRQRPGRDSKRKKYEIVGKVVDGNDAPVAGASLVIFATSGRGVVAARPDPAKAAPRPVDDRTFRDLFSLEPDEMSEVAQDSGIPAVADDAPKARVVARTESQPDGTFRVRTPTRGPWRLEASHATSGHAVVSAARADGKEVLIKLGSAVRFTGTVTDEASGGPVAGATVVVRGGRILRSVTTGADGTFALSDLNPGKYSVDAGAEGYAAWRSSSVTVGEGESLEIKLGSGYSVRVKVMEYMQPPPGWRRGQPRPEGAAIQGAVVVLLRARTNTWRSGVSGPDGSVIVDKLGAGTWRVAVEHDGYNVGFARALRIKEGSPRLEEREVRLYKDVPKKVIVMDTYGNPLRKAKVYWGGVDQEFDFRHSEPAGETDEQGAVTVVFDDGIDRKSVLWVVPADPSKPMMMLEPDDPDESNDEKLVVP